MVRACKSPITQIAENAGEDGGVVANKVLENKYARTSATTPAQDRYCDMVKEGIIDPTKVVRSALQNAASVATLLLDQRRPGGRDAQGRKEAGRRRWRLRRHVLIRTTHRPLAA